MNRTLSSQLWLKRQEKDPYVKRARKEGFRSRSAYKIEELNIKYKLFNPGRNVLDLGSSPGGWLQIASKYCGNGSIIGVDISPIERLAGVFCIETDLYSPKAIELIRKALPEGADVVLSDMAPKATGHRSTDMLRTAGLAELALEVALNMLNPGGDFVVKIMRGGAEGEILVKLRKYFASVRHSKPKASRSNSAELFLVAKNFISDSKKND